MAESMIQLLLNELSRVAKEEITLQRGVREEIEKVKKELESMKAFLRYADANKEEQDPRFESWVEQVRDVSFEIEDVVDEYLYRLADAELRRNNTYLGKLCSTFRKLKAKHQIGTQLQSIKGKVADIVERPKKYGFVPSSFNPSDEKGSSSSRATQEINEFRRSMVDESQLVGIESTKKKLEAWLNDDDPKFKVLAIVGMGGLGKTALAKKILSDASHFKKRALATVSQTLKEDEFFMDLIQQLFPREASEMQQLPVHHQKERLRERLEDDSYLIVVDDVWKIKHWDQIKVTFPRNNHGSRVVVTTRKEPVARHSTKEYNGHSKEERFIDVISKTDQENRTKARRLSIHHSYKISSDVLPQLRSLLFFEGTESGGFKTSKLFGDGLKMLGVLDFTHAPLDTFPEEISTLYLLRHLRLRHTNISVIPKFIRNLQRLETLDLKHTFVTELPDEISMLQKLRHLLISNFNTYKETSFARKHFFSGDPWQNITYKAWGVRLTSNIGCLVSLQHLCLIEVLEDKDWLKGLGRLTQLRKLGLLNLKEQHWEQVCVSISMMTNLHSLKLQTYGSIKLDYMRDPPRLLQRLRLEGQMDELPSWVCCSSLPHLQLLKLVNTKLSKDPGACLGSFPNLAGLTLYEAFNEDVKMRVVLPDCFPSLRMLVVDRNAYLGGRIEVSLIQGTFQPKPFII
ncbi:hypothetical protein RJT34_11065 [Clitoria ternatea]|uniref:Uncharacterized protein n=1 Tax=Clitoria ternatea TaxID=43366 RepID=A0AAN9JJ85_CLITE